MNALNSREVTIFLGFSHENGDFHRLLVPLARAPVGRGESRLRPRGKGHRITPSYSCGRGLGTHVDMPAEQNKRGTRGRAERGGDAVLKVCDFQWIIPLRFI